MKKIVLIFGVFSVFFMANLFAGKLYYEDGTKWGTIKKSYLNAQYSDPTGHFIKIYKDTGSLELVVYKSCFETNSDLLTYSTTTWSSINNGADVHLLDSPEDCASFYIGPVEKSNIFSILWGSKDNEK